MKLLTEKTDTLHRYGVIVPCDKVDTALAVGVDYVEPTIVGNLLVAGDNGWVKNPAYIGPDAAPSFAILFPADIRVSDPGFPAADVTAYLESALAVIASVATDGAKIVFGSGRARRIPEGVDYDAAEKRFAEVLIEARDIAARHHLRIMLEPLHKGESNLLHSIGECAAFLDRHGIDGVPIVADLFHIMLEHEPLDAIREHAALIGHAHIADDGRRPPGQGDWPLGEFLSVLRTSGYDGTVSIECIWADYESELPAALDHLRGLER